MFRSYASIARPTTTAETPSAFSAILVYAQELVPGKVGTMSGLFFGSSAPADRQAPPFVFHLCSYLPLIGLLTALLPNLGTVRRRISTTANT